MKGKGKERMEGKREEKRKKGKGEAKRKRENVASYTLLSRTI